jgi:hypothetical protein
VYGTIDLNYQIGTGAIEVDYKTVDHLLTMEVEPVQLAPPQPRP